MTDADATITEGSIERMYGWFSDSTIGAVGAKAIRRRGISSERQYRDMFETIREENLVLTVRHFWKVLV